MDEARERRRAFLEKSKKPPSLRTLRGPLKLRPARRRSVTTLATELPKWEAGHEVVVEYEGTGHLQVMVPAAPDTTSEQSASARAAAEIDVTRWNVSRRPPSLRAEFRAGNSALLQFRGASTPEESPHAFAFAIRFRTRHSRAPSQRLEPPRLITLARCRSLI